MESIEGDGWRVEYGVGSHKTPRSVARVAVEGVEGVSESISPEGLRERCANERTADTVADGAVGTFRYAIQLWAVWWAQHMSNSVGCEIGGEQIRDILSTIVRDEAQDGMFTSLFKSGLEEFERGENV